MAKLSKSEIKEHNIAVELLQKNTLTFNEKVTVLEKYNEAAVSLNSEAGAFFTPHDLAYDFSLNLYKSATTIDLCAGIGGLAFAAYHYQDCHNLTCVELNPIYYEIGKKLLPEANWINTSIFNYKEFGKFEQCISNPPFGKIKTGIDKNVQSELKYKGAEFDLITIEIASMIADYGCFILPQRSTPFKYSGQPYFIDTRIQSKGYNPNGLTPTAKVQKFIKETGFDYQFNIGVDTSVYKDSWKGVSPTCEIVTFEWNPL